MPYETKNRPNAVQTRLREVISSSMFILAGKYLAVGQLIGPITNARYFVTVYCPLGNRVVSSFVAGRSWLDAQDGLEDRRIGLESFKSQ